jgi:threonine aldolase
MNREIPRQFASDTNAGICPEAFAAMVEANRDHVPAYGDDPWTAKAQRLFRELFEIDCEVFFVATGTASNALALAALCQPFHGVFCHADAHIHTDECGAPEYAAHGIKVIPLEGRSGKLEPDRVRQAVRHYHDVHSHKPGVLSLSQSTEAGTVYSLEEVRALGSTARELGLLVHMDGARFANAVAALNIPPRQITWEAGVDVLCFGGTKNGLASGDAIVFFDPKRAEGFPYRRKQAGHLQAKMRYVSAPWAALLESGAWLRNAEHANAMARQLSERLKGIPGVQVLFPPQANAVFVQMPADQVDELRRAGWRFYSMVGGQRLMCSWDTQMADVAALASTLEKMARGQPQGISDGVRDSPS